MLTVPFYLKNIGFGCTAWCSDRSAIMASGLFYLFRIGLWSRLLAILIAPSWERNSLLLYISLTQILAGTALQGEAMADFSLSLTKPRSWLLYLGTLMWGRQLGQRGLLLLLFLLLMPLWSGEFNKPFASAGRLAVFLPLLGVIDALYSLLFCCLRLCYRHLNAFKGAIVKTITLLGGAILPLSELRVSWQALLLNSPLADLIFQPCYYAIQGHFYQMTLAGWLVRMGIQLASLSLLLLLVYRLARYYHQSEGG